MLNIEKIINNEKLKMTQDKRVVRGKRLNYEEDVHWYIDE